MHAKQMNHLTPQQPYLVLNSDRYQRILMDQSGISHFYEFTVKDGECPDVQAVPDGSVDLLFSIGEHDVRTVIGGTVLKLKQWPIDNKRLHFGVRFQPGEYILPEEISIRDVVNEDVEWSSSWFGADFGEALAACGSLQERAKCFWKRYLAKAEEAQEGSTARTLEHYLRRRIYESKGGISISALAAETGYSECYIRRIFGSIHGISPKVFERFVRFQHVLEIMKQGARSLEEIALECGYYDQSHMIKDFRVFSGTTPEHYQIVVASAVRNRI